jgi:hypothetical protein
MTFNWLNKQGVESDAGFVLQFTGRFTAEYREGGKIVTLDVEDGFTQGMPCISLDYCAFDHWDDGSVIPPARRAQLFDNVRQALEFQGLQLAVENALPAGEGGPYPLPGR